MRPAIIPLLLLTLISAASAQRSAPASRTELDSITMRGEALAGYDVAAWHASDAVMALNPTTQSTQFYVARQTPSGWEVAFGHLTEERDTFMIAYLATQGKDSATFNVRKLDPVREETGWYLAAVKAPGPR